MNFQAASVPNRLLASLDARTLEALHPELTEVELGLKEYVYRAGKPIEHVYFPVNGVLSMLSPVEGMAPVEVATVGNEGMAGLPVFLGAATTPGDAFSQVPGRCLRMTTPAFLDATRELPPLLRLMGRFTQAMFVQISQSSACNRAHSADERCARWLLMTHDRVGDDEFLLTQQFIAQMLGVRRPTVTTVMAILSQAGFIGYDRDRVRVINRAGLHGAACTCYDIIRHEYDELLGAR